MKSHDCTRLSSSAIRLFAFAARHASVCSHPPRYGIYLPRAAAGQNHIHGPDASSCPALS
eukprot:1485933-Prymnesium_polylepis.1